jgi:hypothetical protein
MFSAQKFLQHLLCLAAACLDIHAFQHCHDIFEEEFSIVGAATAGQVLVDWGFMRPEKIKCLELATDPHSRPRD